MKNSLIIIIALIAITGFTNEKSKSTLAPPSPLYGVLQNSDSFKQLILPELKKVAVTVRDANYTGTGSIEKTRTAFANRILQGNTTAINVVLGTIINQGDIPDLNVDLDVLNSTVNGVFTNKFDAIAGAI